MNIGGYAKTLRALGRLVPARMAKRAAATLTGLMQEGYASGSDPYDQAWAPLKYGGPSHLTDTGAMRAGTKATPMSGSGINFVAPSPANFHQSGTSRMPRRRVLPDSGLPSRWADVLQDAFTEAIKESLP